MAKEILKALVYKEIEAMTNKSNNEKDNLQIIKDHLEQSAKRREALLKGQPSCSTLLSKKQKDRTFFDKIDYLDDEAFCNTFGMQRSTFEVLDSILQPHWLRQTGANDTYSLKQCLLLTLWKLCSSCSFREMCSSLNSDYTNIYNKFVETIQLIARLKNEFIKFPRTAQMQHQSMQQFQEAAVQGLPNMLGYLGMLQMPISTDTIANVQVVIDAELKFIDVHVDCAGSHQHALVWYNSPLQQQIRNGTISLPKELHLVGDINYTLQTHLLVPYHDDGEGLEAQQLTYNDILGLSYMQVEHTFDILRQRFKILSTLETQDMSTAIQIILVCMVLHNIVLINEECEQLASCSSPAGKAISVRKNNLLPVKDEFIKETQDARTKRDQIARQLAEYVF